MNIHDNFVNIAWIAILTLKMDFWCMLALYHCTFNTVCDMDEIESEIHIMICCPLYNDIRATLNESALLIDNDFNIYINMDKFVFFIDNKCIIRNSAKACHSILHRRRKYVYIND